MEPRDLLLVDAVAMLAIAFSSDSWIYVSYPTVHPDLPIPAPCKLHVQTEYSILECGQQRRLLTTQYSSLFRQCNDLTESQLQNLSSLELIYSSSCVLVLRAHRWRFRACSFRADILALLFAIGSLFFGFSGLAAARMVAKPVFAPIPSMLFGCVLCSTGALLITILSISRINTSRHIIHSENERHRIDQLVNMWRRAEPGWSWFVGALGTIIVAICAHLYNATRKKDRIRQRHVRRRRLMRNAMMSSCREEVALATRVKMTVI